MDARQAIDGGATNISVGPNGMPCVTNSDNRIYVREVAPPPPPPPPPPPLHRGRGAIVSSNGKCLDAEGGDFDALNNNGRVWSYDCHGGPNQQWRLDSGVVLPMAPERFDQMFRAVRSLASIDERLNRIKDYLTPETYFTTQQIAQLMQLTTFASERLRIAVLLWPRVVDPDRFPDLVTLFSFESERQELRRQLGR